MAALALRWLNAFSSLVILFILACQLDWAHAQYNRSQISGFVRDQSGAAVPGVTVAVHYPAIAFSRETISDETGYYVLLDLPAGECQVSAELPGFKKFLKVGLPLPTETKLQVDIDLTVGEISEVVEVRAAPQ